MCPDPLQRDHWKGLTMAKNTHASAAPADIEGTILNDPTVDLGYDTQGTDADAETAEKVLPKRQAATAQSVEYVAIGTEDFISMANCVPSPDWINQNVVAKGQGFKLPLARLVGSARLSRRKTNEVKGQQLESVALEGSFMLTSFVTGEVTRAPVAYLPKMWARQVEALLEDIKDDPNTKVRMDLTLGIQATGKTIPYRWTVTQHVALNELENDELHRMMLQRPTASAPLRLT